MSDQNQSNQNPAVHEAGLGPTGDTPERFAGGGLETENNTPENSGGGTDTGITGDDIAGGGLTGGSNGNALDDPTTKRGTV